MRVRINLGEGGELNFKKFSIVLTEEGQGDKNILARIRGLDHFSGKKLVQKSELDDVGIHELELEIKF